MFFAKSCLREAASRERLSSEKPCCPSVRAGGERGKEQTVNPHCRDQSTAAKLHRLVPAARGRYELMHKVREEPAAQFARETPLLQGTWRRPPSLTTVCNEKNISGGVWFPIKPLSYACPVACGCRSGDAHCPGTCPARTAAAPRCPDHQRIWGLPSPSNHCPVVPPRSPFHVVGNHS